MDDRYSKNTEQINALASYINAKYFDNKINFAIKYDNHNKKIIWYYSDTIEVNNNTARKIINLSYDNAINDKEYLAKELITQMLIYEGESIGEKRYSNHGYYRSKKFNEAAQKIGCETCYTGHRNGFTITKIPNDCQRYLKKINFIPYKYYDQRHNGKITSVNRTTSTVKYADPKTGESVRGTKKNHFLICFDECPEIGEKVEKMFGKKRMVIA